MQLVALRVTNYKSVDDSGEFTIADLTCLAGKNESGKTALLQALRRLRPVEAREASFNKTMEYPRRRMQDFEAGRTGVRRHTSSYPLRNSRP